MTVTHAPRSHHLPVSATLGGLTGGFLFGMIMYSAGMLPVVAQLVRSDSLWVGVAVHMFISAFFGALYGAFVSRHASSAGGALLAGLGYGVFWWVAGGNVLMPLLLGMPVSWEGFTSEASLISFLGHLVYGVATSLTSRGFAALDA